MDGEAIKKFNELKKEINSLRSDLNKINEEKEYWAKQERELREKISGLFKDLKSIRSEKDKSNKELHELRKKRDEYNSKVKKLIEEAKALNAEKRDFIKKQKIRIDPSKIKAKIDQLDESIETQGYTFDKEKKVMEEIKKLKKIYNEYSKLTEINDNLDKLSAEINENKNKANEHHMKLKEYEKSSAGYTEFLNLSKIIGELKIQQKKAFEMFISLKRDFIKINNLLKDQLTKTKDVPKDFSRDLSKKIFDHHKDKKILENKKKEHEDKIVEEKVKNVEEKIKKKKKLTTEDLIAYQGKNE